MKDIDLTDKVPLMPIEDQIKFIDNPSLKDLEEAQEKDFIIVCRMQGTVQEKLAQAKEIKERLGDSFISNRLVLEGYFKDEPFLSKEDYQSLIRKMIKDSRHEFWNPPAGWDRGNMKEVLMTTNWPSV